ncbi:hypothetical protein ID866_675 [Astraeus odoratus]|nr:hypothetical protein ID866_675 [Astraeus odoratus]
MNVGVSLTPAPELSFEELRIQDYLKAYMSTRQPPAPCPQTPEDPAVRASLGLPPLFVPMPVRNTDGGSSNGVARLPTDLPGVHSFEPSKITGESFQCISAQPLYSLFSHEVGNARPCYFPYFLPFAHSPPRQTVHERNTCLVSVHTD